MQSLVAPHVPLYPPGAPGLGQPLFYGQPPPAIVPQLRLLSMTSSVDAGDSPSRVARGFGTLQYGGEQFEIKVANEKMKVEN
ncbi:hypothetical protein ZIOFF_022348 [Zingiber officinale]|uniref:Uncharacterized protein n=1 Tax=Zingiber officinale TaxID=94328 RepID=A0A8J5LH60_ZINOF|nr:hypothetical protein ZIOFF_022348 [Zingiber officinale]